MAAKQSRVKVGNVVAGDAMQWPALETDLDERLEFPFLFLRTPFLVRNFLAGIFHFCLGVLCTIACFPRFFSCIFSLLVRILSGIRCLAGANFLTNHSIFHSFSCFFVRFNC